MRTVKVCVTFEYELEIDDNNEIVKEYGDLEEMVSDCAMRNFGSGLPVISDGGVKLIDKDIIQVFETE
jgi:hypothetical protein